MRKFVKGLCVLGFLVLGFSLQAQDGELEKKQQEATIIHLGDEAPDFTVEMMDGRRVTLSSLKGKVVLVNFWATWCGPCMRELRAVPEHLITPFKDEEDFVFLAISRQEKRETVEKTLAKLKADGIEFPAGLDSDRSIYSKYAEAYIPRNFLVGKDGKVVFESIGFSEKKIADVVKAIKTNLKK